jgi:hypothetical protein
MDNIMLQTQRRLPAETKRRRQVRKRHKWQTIHRALRLRRMFHQTLQSPAQQLERHQPRSIYLKILVPRATLATGVVTAEAAEAEAEAEVEVEVEVAAAATQTTGPKPGSLQQARLRKMRLKFIAT